MKDHIKVKVKKSRKSKNITHANWQYIRCRGKRPIFDEIDCFVTQELVKPKDT